MADFVKKTWKCDDTITADELNRMEDGIEEALSSGGGTASEPLIVEVNTFNVEWEVRESETQDWTWQGIHDEYVKGRTILFQEVTPGIPAFKKEDKFGSVVSVSSNVQDGLESKYYIDVYVQGQLCRFFASAPNRGVTYDSAS